MVIRAVFFGSGEFAVPVFEALIRNKAVELSLVVTQPDRKGGRHLKRMSTPVKKTAQKYNVPVFSPVRINSQEAVDCLKGQRADFFVVVSYGCILSSGILDLVTKFSVNIHPSLLPRYRGAAPVNWALICGERLTGLSFIRMNAAMDRGDIIFQKKVAIKPGENVRLLEKRLSYLAADLLGPVLKKAAVGKLTFRKQEEQKASYARRLKKKDGLIRWQESAEAIYASFLGCYGWPGSYTFLKAKPLKILKMTIHLAQGSHPPGVVFKIVDKAILVGCQGGGVIAVREVLPEGKKAMSVKSFLAGHSLEAGDRFETESR